MRIFQCTNKSCPAHRPADGKTNRVLECVEVRTPLEEDGTPSEEPNASRAFDLHYKCGFCEKEVRELSGKDLVECRILKVSDGFLLGQFRNKLRGDYMFNFAYRIENHKVFIKEEQEGFKPWRLEIDQIIDHCMQEFKDNAIDIEVTDCEVVEGRKVYTVSVLNRTEGVRLTVEADRYGIVEDYGKPRDLLSIEKKKVLDYMREAAYL